jgi:hypothetical protein
MEEQIESRTHPSSRAVLLASVLLLVLGVCAWWGLPLVTASKKVVIKVGTDGVARVYGIPFANKSLRKAALSVIARSKTTVHLNWESPGGEQTINKPLTRGGATPAQLELLHAMAKAGMTNYNTITTFSTK